MAFPIEVMGPVKFAFVVTFPAVRPEAVPVMFVPTKADGVPSAGVTRVGLVARTTLPVPVVEPAVKLPPDVVATTGTLAPTLVVTVPALIVEKVVVPGTVPVMVGVAIVGLVASTTEPAPVVIRLMAAVTRPLPFTVTWAGAKVPTLELTVARVEATVPGPVAVTSPVRPAI